MYLGMHSEVRETCVYTCKREGREGGGGGGEWRGERECVCVRERGRERECE